jgi:hypothetical protein
LTWKRLASTVAGLAACSPAHPAPITGDESCFVVPAVAPNRDTVTLSFTDRIDATNAPVPQNEAERFVFRHTTATLVRFDCHGELMPELARSWSRDSSGFVWTFRLVPEPTGPLSGTAELIVAEWEARRNGGIWPWPRILEVRAIGTDSLAVRLDTAFAEVPREFGLPFMAVGYGRYRSDISLQAETGPLLELLHLVPRNPNARLPVIRVQTLRRGMDERDLLDLPRVGFLRPADVLISSDPMVIDYARRKPGFRAVPLPWNRTYVLVTPGRVTLSVGDSNAFRLSLSDDVVRAESRMAAAPGWWAGLNCPGTMPLLPMGRQPLVVYPVDDKTARELAERIVALESRPLRTRGLLPDALAASLAGGDATLYVIPVPLPRAGCRSLPLWPAAVSVFPLVETRAHALIAADVPPFTIEGDGAIQFELPADVLPRGGAP